MPLLLHQAYKKFSIFYLSLSLYIRADTILYNKFPSVDVEQTKHENFPKVCQKIIIFYNFFQKPFD